MIQDKIWNVPWVKRCNFYSYDGRKDVTLRNRICEILTKSRKPPKVEDFVTRAQSFRCRCRWFPIVPDPGGHASMRLKFLAQRYTSINDYRRSSLSPSAKGRHGRGHASMDLGSEAERSECLVPTKLGHNPPPQIATSFRQRNHQKWTIVVRIFVKVPGGHASMRLKY